MFVSVNVVGLFVHNLMEQSQRKAFLDTRNCIAARLEMEDENEKLVGTLFLEYSLCQIYRNTIWYLSEK